MAQGISASAGRAALRALLKEGSPLGPLKVMARHIGRYFQTPLPGFRAVCGLWTGGESQSTRH